MGEKTAIEWTRSDDGRPGASWNPIRGVAGRWHCTKVSPGCQHCYAERMNISARHHHGPPYKVGADALRLDERILRDPLRWKEPRRIFVCSMTDLYHEDVPDEWIDKILAVIGLARQHTFLALTKRSKRQRAHLAKIAHSLSRQNDLAEAAVGVSGSPCADGAFEDAGWPLPNHWIGASVESPTYLWRLDDLLQTPGVIRFGSFEPLLGGMNLRPFLRHPFNREPHCPWCEDCITGHPLSDERWKQTREDNHGPFLDWVIPGGESGGPPERALVVPWGSQEKAPGFGDVWPSRTLASGRWEPRLQAVEWMRSLRDQCQATGTAFFLKQWGGPLPTSGGRLLDGREWSEFPARPGG